MIKKKEPKVPRKMIRKEKIKNKKLLNKKNNKGQHLNQKIIS